MSKAECFEFTALVNNGDFRGSYCVHCGRIESDHRRLPYPWCHGSPTKADCVARGSCNRDPNCGE